jgi:uncharacterized phage protein (TIGR01671 family)
MPREIKFRGKQVGSGKWVYGLLLKNKLGIYIITEENPHECTLYGYITIEQYYRVIPETVGEFTGLKDKNGKEVYEPDLLFDGEQTWLVEYARTMCGFHARDIHAKSCNIFSLYHLCNRHNQKREVEVIGNIHDNPSLLEVSSC